MAESSREEIAKLEALYANNPGGRVFTHLAEAYRKAGELDRARKILEDGIARHADYASAQVVLGRVLLDLGESDEATIAFRRVLELDPENRVAIRALGDLAHAGGREAEALTHYRHLLALDPTDEQLRRRVDEIASAPSIELDDETAAEAEAFAVDPDTSATSETTTAELETSTVVGASAADLEASSAAESGLDTSATGEAVAPEPESSAPAEAWSQTEDDITSVDDGVIETGSYPYEQTVTSDYALGWDTSDNEESNQLPGDLAHLMGGAPEGPVAFDTPLSGEDPADVMAAGSPDSEYDSSLPIDLGPSEEMVIENAGDFEVNLSASDSDIPEPPAQGPAETNPSESADQTRPWESTAESKSWEAAEAKPWESADEKPWESTAESKPWESTAEPQPWDTSDEASSWEPSDETQSPESSGETDPWTTEPDAVSPGPADQTAAKAEPPATMAPEQIGGGAAGFDEPDETPSVFEQRGGDASDWIVGDDAILDVVSRAEPAPAPQPSNRPEKTRESTPEPSFEALLSSSRTANYDDDEPQPTETLAELYRAQGFDDQAAAVYRALLVKRPGDARLQQRLADLEARGAITGAGSHSAEPGDDSADGLESAWIDTGTSDDATPSPFAWKEEAGGDVAAGPSIGAYFSGLLGWKPANKVPAPGGSGVTHADRCSGAIRGSPTAGPRAGDDAIPLSSDLLTVETDPWGATSPDTPDTPAGLAGSAPLAADSAPQSEPKASQPERTAARAEPTVTESALIEPTVPAPNGAPQSKLDAASPASSSPANASPVDAAFDEWFTAGPGAAPSAPHESTAPSEPGTTAGIASPAEASADLEASAAAEGTDEESDDDLELFRSWLQSLKR